MFQETEEVWSPQASGVVIELAVFPQELVKIPPVVR